MTIQLMWLPLILLVIFSTIGYIAYRLHSHWQIIWMFLMTICALVSLFLYPILAIIWLVNNIRFI